jgi:hypothetical protein
MKSDTNREQRINFFEKGGVNKHRFLNAAVIGTNRDKSHPDEKRGEQNPSDKPKRNLFLGLLGQGGIVFGDSLGAF